MKNYINLEVATEATISDVSEVKEAKDGRQYFVATLKFGFGVKSAKRTFWQQKKDNGTMEWERGSHEEALALKASGEKISCLKVTKSVVPYKISEERDSVDTFSTVVFTDETVEQVFTNNQKEIINESGEILNPIKARLSNRATVSESGVAAKTASPSEDMSF